MLKVTTSWDDGDILDRRLANLLSHYGIKGTFYIAKNYRPGRLSESDIRHIADNHEIGAHTLTHPDLRTLSAEKMREEIAGSKKWLEELLGSKVLMFCYPKGLYNDAVIRLIKEAGFLGARTTEFRSTTISSDPFRMATTLQVYPFPFRKLDEKRYYFGKFLQPFTQRSSTFRALGVPTRSMYSWPSTAKAAFDATLKRGGVFHLWGHSWEIEQYGMWQDLEKLLQYISNKETCSYVTNGELIK